MLFKSAIALLLASLPSLVAAAPAGKGNQSSGILKVTLYAHVLGNSEEVYPAVDGDAAPVPASFGYPVSNVQIQCIGQCPPQYHCTVYGRRGKAFGTVSGQGGKVNPAQPVIKVSCSSKPKH
ncbi:hypothetical protein SLS64_014261 [Diaporthe eres]|uniref:Uncharacterized protein n=1 Tax=Diaporthe eres TaxID=83184 RepID=A0ABR1P5N0_DIAER